MLVIYGNNLRVYRCALKDLFASICFRPSLCVLRHHLKSGFANYISVVNFEEMLFVTEHLYACMCFDVYDYYYRVPYLTIIKEKEDVASHFC